MTRHNRINAIITLLQLKPQTVNSLVNHFNGKVSPRQVRNDIESIKALGYGDRPGFEKVGRANRKTWQIKPSEYERNAQRLSRGVLPEFVFAVRRYESLKKHNNWAVDDHNLAVDSTHFYETEAHDQLDQGLEQMIRAIDEGRKLIVHGLTGDATSILELVRFPLTILPIKILYHRGCFYVAAVVDETEQVLTFQIDQLTFTETKGTFERAAFIELVESNLDQRFGISQNINNEVYDITLRFSAVTGRFVSEQFWHKHQTAEPIGNDWLITFHCGINRELVGWIFQWMSNVRVIGPPKLKELYDKQLARILVINGQPSEDEVIYTNQFAATISIPA